MSTATATTAGRQSGRSTWTYALGVGIAGGLVGIYLSLVGIAPTFGVRPLITGLISLGQGALLATFVGAAFLAARRGHSGLERIAFGAIAGSATGVLLAVLMIADAIVPLRPIVRYAAEPLWNLLSLSFYPDPIAPTVPVIVGAFVGALTGAAMVLPRPVQRSLLAAGVGLAMFGLFAGVLRVPMLASPFAWLARQLFAPEGLLLYGAVVTLAGALGWGIGAWTGGQLGYRRGGAIGGVLGGVVLGFLGGQLAGTLLVPTIRMGDALAIGALVGGALGIGVGGTLGGYTHRRAHQARVDERFEQLPNRKKRLAMLPFFLVGLVIVLFIPQALGLFVAQVVALVALYMMMAMGLNITLGMAGLLDLGFVAFFAVGAYTVGLMTSAGGFGVLDWPFWAAVPFAVLFAFIFGAFLGLPVLGIRGDYLAIATLGFGEIVRILTGSDLLKPWLGGPQGVTLIPPPLPDPPRVLDLGLIVLSDPFDRPKQAYYIALAAAALIAFLSYRLRDSRLGRAWIAIREDEDVAEALGINLVQTKLLAYSLGAAFAGLGGAVFAGLIGAIFPTSINLFVSINVAAIVIIGGMGSVPGVALGAVFLIGLPELFREFSEYRFLFYGAALILAMRFRPEGLLPAMSVARELHVEEENVEPPDATVGESVEAPDGAEYPPQPDATVATDETVEGSRASEDRD